MIIARWEFKSQDQGLRLTAVKWGQFFYLFIAAIEVSCSEAIQESVVSVVLEFNYCFYLFTDNELITQTPI